MVSLQNQIEDLKAKSSPRGVGRSPRMVRGVCLFVNVGIFMFVACSTGCYKLCMGMKCWT